jgi:molybdate transport system ATP-binding protein
MNSIDAHFEGRFGTFMLDVSFSIPSKGITGLFGPSGCGKTTILRCLAGLARVSKGYLQVDGEIWEDEHRRLPSHARPVGYVFQDARLFTHLSVLDNLRYGMKRSSTRQAIAMDPVLDLMGLRSLLKRSPAALSGGEKQRVAIGRALLSQPQLLLMDEPLSALDHDTRNEILPYLEQLHETLSIPIIYVTHDLSEIERLADHLLLMPKSGHIQASGTLAAVLTDLSLPTSRRPEAVSLLDGIVVSYDAHYEMTLCRIGPLQVDMPGNLGAPGTHRRLRVHANDVSLAKVETHETSILNVLPARVVAVEAVSASQIMVLLALFENDDNGRLLSSVTRKSWERLGLKIGDRVFAQLKSMALVENG